MLEMAIIKRCRLLDGPDITAAKKFSLPRRSRICNHQESMKMVARSFYIPKENEEKPLGEDAHFICAEKQCIGVADGVGSWAKKGIDSGEYARRLMFNAMVALHYQEKGDVDLREVLNDAYANTKEPGSSTACMLSLSGKYLRGINVGDSGFRVFREGKIIYESSAQQKKFNCPYQLGNCRDDPSSAVEMEVEVRPGDIVVLGTDGVFDNVYSHELEDLVQKGPVGIEMAEVLATKIAEFALEMAEDELSIRPFGRDCRQVMIEHVGGKYDDITVVVAHIV